MGSNQSQENHKFQNQTSLRKSTIVYGSKFTQQGLEELKSNYITDKSMKKIGSGSFGVVHQTTNRADESMKVAIKVINKEKVPNNNVAEEIDILKRVDHPNIVKYLETYNDKRYVYLVMQFVNGKTLMEQLSTKSKNCGEHAIFTKQYMKGLLEAVTYLHKQDLTHRDIKPENIMVTEDDVVTLIDFGIATEAQGENEGLTTFSGTPAYMAPEVIRGKYGKKADVWSCGVVLFYMAFGKLPFDGRKLQQLQREIQAGELTFPAAEQEESCVSDECKELISKMLAVDPTMRPSAEACLNDDYFEIDDSDGVESPRIVRRQTSQEMCITLKKLQSFEKCSSTLNKAATSLVVNTMPCNDISLYKESFQQLDKNGDGMIDQAELGELIQMHQHSDRVKAEVHAVIDQMNSNGKGQISYSEYLAATSACKQFLRGDRGVKRLRAVFDIFDTDRDGKISVQNIQHALQKLGNEEFTRDQIRETLSKYDRNNDRVICFDEFAAMLCAEAEMSPLAQAPNTKTKI